MYQVGFGDCFLISFAYSTAPLADGTQRAPRADRLRLHPLAQETTRRGTANSRTTSHSRTGGKLDVLVITHRHKDHLGGFADDTAAATIAALQTVARAALHGRRTRAQRRTPPAPPSSANARSPTPTASTRRRHSPARSRAPSATDGRDSAATCADGDRAARKPGRDPPPRRARADAISGAGATIRRPTLRHRRCDPRRDDEGARPADDRPVASRRRSSARTTPNTGSANAGLLAGMLQTVNAPPAVIRRSPAAAGRRPDDRPRPAPLDRRADARPADPLAAADRHQPRGRAQQHQHHPPIPNRHSEDAVPRATPRSRTGPTPSPRPKASCLRADLADLDLYKVGHHGSRNASPRSLVKQWQTTQTTVRRPDVDPRPRPRQDRSNRRPRQSLVDALKALGTLHQTDGLDTTKMSLAVTASTRDRKAFDLIPG